MYLLTRNLITQFSVGLKSPRRWLLLFTLLFLPVNPGMRLAKAQANNVINPSTSGSFTLAQAPRPRPTQPLVADRDLGKIEGDRQLNGTLAPNTQHRIYKFQITTGALELTLDRFNGDDLSLEIYKRHNLYRIGQSSTSHEDLITRGYKLSSGEQQISMQGLVNGTYYVALRKRRRMTIPLKYVLDMKATPGQLVQELASNDTANNASELDPKLGIPLVGDRLIQGVLDSRDRTDYWRFTLQKTSHVEARFSAQGISSLEILDANRNVLKKASYSQFDRLPAGTYYAKVTNHDRLSLPYQLMLGGTPVYGGALKIKMHRITALDDFESAGRKEADFFYKATIDKGYYVRELPTDRNDLIFTRPAPFEESVRGEVSIGKRIIPFSLELLENDGLTQQQADINPQPSMHKLELEYDTLTGQITGSGLAISQEGQKITVRGRSNPSASVTFEVNYDTLTTRDI